MREPGKPRTLLADRISQEPSFELIAKLLIHYPPTTPRALHAPLTPKPRHQLLTSATRKAHRSNHTRPIKGYYAAQILPILPPFTVCSRATSS
jgi:hypothetical protein